MTALAQAPPESKSPGSLAGDTEAHRASSSDAKHSISPSHSVKCFLALSAASKNPQLSRSDIACLAVILDHYNVAKGIAWPGVNRIATAAAIHRTNVMRAITRLEACGYVFVDRPGKGKANRYVPTFSTSSDGATSSESATSSTDATEVVAPALLELVAPALPELIYGTYPENISKEIDQKSASLVRFDDFWEAYPRKVSKAKARAAWKRLRLDPFADQILADVQQRRSADPQWRDMAFIPHPSSYLNGERWLDSWRSEQQGDQHAKNGQRDRKSYAAGATASFRDVKYTGTPFDQLSNELREGVEKSLASI